jgi:hypothetical protein
MTVADELLKLLTAHQLVWSESREEAACLGCNYMELWVRNREELRQSQAEHQVELIKIRGITP